MDMSWNERVAGNFEDCGLDKFWMEREVAI